MWKPLVLAIALLILLPVPSAYAGSCKLKSGNMLYLKGDTDKEMLDCLLKLDLSEIDTVLLKSRGGPVRHALQIGELIAEMDAHMVIKDYCNSSCANYFLPLAKTVTVKPKSEFLLHGSIDPGMVRKHLTMRDGWEIHDQQEAYARKHKVHRGWLLYRSDYSDGGHAKFDYLEGNPGRVADETGAKAFQVERRLFESCFPYIPVTFERPTLIEKAKTDPRTRRRFLKNKIRPSGTRVCKGAFDPNWPVPNAENRVPVDDN